MVTAARNLPQDVRDETSRPCRPFGWSYGCSNNYTTSRICNLVWRYSRYRGRRILWFASQSSAGLTSSNLNPGTGYVEGFDEGTDKITFTVPATTSQLYDLKLVYNGPYGDKYTYVVLNGAGGSQVSLPSTTTWTTVSAGQVLLNAGSNTIEVQNNWGWYLIDSIILSPSPKRGAHKITTQPVSPNANADAKALLKYLGSIYGKNILSGQQDQASLDWVTANVGKTPAILGLDLMDYTESRISRGASSTDVDKAIAFNKKGGIVSFVWHWGAPTGLYDNATQPWWSGFYTAATDFNLTTALKVHIPTPTITHCLH